MAAAPVGPAASPPPSLAAVRQEYAAVLQLSLSRPSQPANGLAGLALVADLAAVQESLARCQAAHADAGLRAWEETLREEGARVAGRAAAIGRTQAWVETLRGVLAAGVVATLEQAGSGRVALAADLAQAVEAIGAAAGGTDWEEEVRRHIVGVTERYRAGLGVCYEVAGVPRTNNDLERGFGEVRQGARRQTGLKQATRWLQRHGAWLVYTATGTVADIAAQLGQVGAAAYAAERARWEAQQERFRQRYRWQRTRGTVLAGLEARWIAASANSTS